MQLVFSFACKVFRTCKQTHQQATVPRHTEVSGGIKKRLVHDTLFGNLKYVTLTYYIVERVHYGNTIKTMLHDRLRGYFKKRHASCHVTKNKDYTKAPKLSRTSYIGMILFEKLHQRLHIFPFSTL